MSNAADKLGKKKLENKPLYSTTKITGDLHKV